MRIQYFLFLLCYLAVSVPKCTFAKHSYIQKDSIADLDSLKTVKDISNHYYFKSGTSRSQYVHVKEKLEILQYIKTLSWTEKEKIEIFKLYANTSYHSEPHETALKKHYEAGNLGEVIRQNLQKLQQRLKAIAGEDDAKNFWQNIELITNKYTDHSQF